MQEYLEVWLAHAGEVVWALKWANVLAPELRGAQHREADHVVLHERVPAPPYDIKCKSPAQARELLHRVQHHLMGLLHVRMLDADLAGSSIEDAEIPPAEVCIQPCARLVVLLSATFVQLCRAYGGHACIFIRVKMLSVDLFPLILECRGTSAWNL